MGKEITGELGSATWNGMDALCKVFFDSGAYFWRKYGKGGVKCKLNHFFKNAGYIKAVNGQITDKPHIAKCIKTNYGWHIIFKMYPGKWMGDIVNDIDRIEEALNAEVYLKRDESGWLHLRVYTRHLPKCFKYQTELAARIIKYPLGLPIGISRPGFDILNLSSDETFALLVAGQPGGGKSTFVRQVLMAIIQNYNPTDATLYLVDMKLGGVEMAPFSIAPHVVDFGCDLKGASRVLRAALAELEYRGKKCAKYGAVGVVSYNKLRKGKDKMPHSLVVIDEWMSLDDKQKDIVLTIAQQGRAYGMHVIICTQHPDHKTLEGRLKALIPCRLVFKVGSQLYSRVALGEGMTQAFYLRGKGHGLFLAKGRLREIQVMHLTDDASILQNMIKKKYPTTVSPVSIELPQDEPRKVTSW